MREAEKKKKLKLKLPHLWNPHKIKKIRQDETEIQNINLGGTCTRRLSPLWRKRLAWLAGICTGKFLIRLPLTIALAIAVYILTYALAMVALYTLV